MDHCQQFSLQRSGYAIKFKIWKWLKLLNSVPFIKKTLANNVCIRIWSFSLTFTVLQWMTTKIKISQFSRFLIRSGCAIHVKIRKWLKLLLLKLPSLTSMIIHMKFVQVFHWLLQYLRFPSSSSFRTLQFRGTLVNHFYIWIWSFWLTFTALQWMKTNFKISEFEDFC